ncbi:MAG: hypothetical protein ACXW4I_02585 [Candidatus Deferrimicrobiaceae bacterium]
MRKMGYPTVLVAVLALLALPWSSVAGDKGHGSMSGMHGEGKTEGHDMMKMGDKIFAGRIGPWQAEARLVDMKDQMEKSKASEKMQGMMKNTHHVMFSLEDPVAKKPVTEGKGAVTVTGPDKKEATYNLTGMEGHFGADITLDKPGKYEFAVEIDAGGKKGSGKFSHTLK